MGARPAARLHPERQLPGGLPGRHPAAHPVARLARPELEGRAGAGRHVAPGSGSGASWRSGPGLYRLGTAVAVRAMRLFPRAAAGSAACRSPGAGPRTATSRRRPDAPSWSSCGSGGSGADERARHHPRRLARRARAAARGARRGGRRRGAGVAGGARAIRPALPLADPLEAFAARVVSPRSARRSTASRPRGAARGSAALPRRARPAVAADAATRSSAVGAGLDRLRAARRGAAGRGRARSAGRAGGSPRPARWSSTPDRRRRCSTTSCRCTIWSRCAPATSSPIWRTTRAVAGPAPRNVNLITGASGTTDIEGSYVRGAHGPRFLHVVLVGAAPP